MRYILPAVVAMALIACSPGSPEGDTATQRRDAASQSKEIPEEQLLALGDGENSVTLLSATSCYSLPQQKGVVRLSGAAGGSARLTMKCGNTVMGTCDATILAGQNAARCEIAKVSVDNTPGLFSCSTRILAGNPTLGAGCQDP